MLAKNKKKWASLLVINGMLLLDAFFAFTYIQQFMTYKGGKGGEQMVLFIYMVLSIFAGIILFFLGVVFPIFDQLENKKSP